jgi:hypothetical protein
MGITQMPKGKWYCSEACEMKAEPMARKKQKKN